MFSIFQLSLQITYEKCNDGEDHEYFLNEYDFSKKECIDQCQDESSTKYVWYTIDIEDKYYKVCMKGQQYCKQSDDDYIIRQSSSSQECVESCKSDDQTYVWYYSDSLQDYVCSDQQQCSEANTNGFKKVTEENECVPHCIGANYDFISSDDDNKCLSSCGEYVYILQNTENKCTKYKSCKEHPTLPKRSHLGYCTAHCVYNSYASTWYYNQELQDNVCMTSEACGTKDSPVETLTRTTFPYFQCVAKCIDSDDSKYGFQYGDAYTCIEYCGDSQVWYYDETDKDNICSGKPSCGGDELPLSLYPIELANKQCISKCSQSVTYSYLNSDKSQCVQSCNEFMWYQLNNENYCTTESKCEQIEGQNLKYIIDGTKQCIQSCKDSEFPVISAQNQDTCVTSCENGVWASIIDSNGNKQTQCFAEEQCSQNEDLVNQKMIKQTADNQCIQNCFQSEQYKFEGLQDGQCVESCGENNWYQKDDGEQVCIQKCDQINLDSINLYDNQCNKEEQCKQYYHFIKQNESIKCYYFTNISSCQQLEDSQNMSINKMIYTYNNTIECTDCSSELRRYQTDDNQLICLHDEIITNRTDGLPLTQIILIIILCVIIVILTIALAITLNKLTKLQKQLVPLLNKSQSKGQLMKSMSTENIETVQAQSVLQPVKYDGSQNGQNNNQNEHA